MQCRVCCGRKVFPAANEWGMEDSSVLGMMLNTVSEEPLVFPPVRCLMSTCQPGCHSPPTQPDKRVSHAPQARNRIAGRCLSYNLQRRLEHTFIFEPCLEPVQEPLPGVWILQQTNVSYGAPVLQLGLSINARLHRSTCCFI